MKHLHAKRHWLIAAALCLALLVCVLTVTTFASSRTNRIAKINLVLNENIDILFWADIDESTAKASGTYVTFNDGAQVTYSSMKEQGGVSYAVFRYDDVLPQNMTDDVTAKLYVGGVLKDTQTYSVKDYCRYMLRYSSSESLKTLVSDLLVYGAAAQTYLGEGDLVTDGVSGMTASATPTELKVLSAYSIEDNLARTETATFSQAGLELGSTVKMYFDVTISGFSSLGDYTAKLRINGREETVSLTDNGNGTYRATFSSIRASEIFDAASVGIYKNDSRISYTAHYSIANYLQAQASNADANLAALVKALYNYGVSARKSTGSHVVTMPGTTTVDNTGTASKDPSGTVAYECALCGEVMGEIPVSHIRDFDNTHANAFANEGTSFTSNLEATDGDGNKYMSVLRGDNEGTGAWGYYFRIGTSQTLSGTYLTNNSYTFEMDMRAPAGGLVASSIILQNERVPSSTVENPTVGRFNTFLDINADGSLTNNGSAVAPAGTINSSEWTHITMMVELCEVNGEKCVYTEYYVNGVLCSAVLIENTVGLDATVDGKAGSAIDPNGQYRFTNIYVGVSPSGLTEEDSAKGVQFDNFIFGQGAVHSFSGSVESYLQQKDNEQMLEIIDLVEAGFAASDYYTVVTSTTGGTEEVSSVEAFDTDAYQPSAVPTSGQHPRLLFNESDIPGIVAAMERDENSTATQNFLNKVKTVTDGKLSNAMNNSHGPGEYNYDSNILIAIEAKALYYALFKDSEDPSRQDAVMRGYQAIYAIKNYLKTFIINYKSSDQCRLYGHVMYVSALVYDWCYDLLSEDDKLQIQLGVQNKCLDGTSSADGSTHNGIKMEVGFPPAPSGTLLTGHNAEFQVLRDYFAFAIAIYDEVPSWYDYVGGMIEQNYVPTQNYLMGCGYYPDGSALYNMYRYQANLWCAWLYKGMGIDLPYDAEDMNKVFHGLISMETYGGNQFATGDGTNTTMGGSVGDCGLIASYLFNDGVARAAALNFHNDYRSFSSSQQSITAADFLILSGSGVETAANYQENVDNVVYYGDWAQQVIARNGKDADSVVVLMQGGQRVPGGHTHQSAGNFQIYYKGQLTRDDGLYDSYGYDHHLYYHMSTVAHNSLLIYNSNNNSTSSYYNGGQRHWVADGVSSLPATYETWITDNTYAYGYNIGMQTDDINNPSYVYFANDITLAYHADTVDYVERSINTVYTGDASVPMVMFIFDHIDSDSADYQKTFLLQCPTEPDINGKVITLDNDTSKLVLTSLQGNDSIMAYGRTSVGGVVGGGEGDERFYISNRGINLNPAGAGSLSNEATDFEEMWGHVEISPSTGSTENLLMNVIYVADSGTIVSATPTLVSGTNVLGATFMNHTSVFVSDPANAAKTLSFTSTGNGTQTYYVGGLAAGKWQVSIGGQSKGVFDVTADGRMLSFEGDAGEVTLTFNPTLQASKGTASYTNTSSATVDLGATLSATNEPVGSLSFDVAATGTLSGTERTSTMYFNNGSANVLDPFLTMTFTRSGSFLSFTRTVTVTGWNGIKLVTYSPSNDNATINFNLKIDIEMKDGLITLTYYVDGVCVGTATKQATDDIAKIVASGYTGASSKGVTLSNGLFYYTDMK